MDEDEVMLLVINKFRLQNGAEEIIRMNRLHNKYCLEHCWAMLEAHNAYNAPSCYLEEGWCDAVGAGYFKDDFFKSVEDIIFNCFGNNRYNRTVLLRDELAFAVTTDKTRECCRNWILYITVRGRNFDSGSLGNAAKVISKIISNH